MQVGNVDDVWEVGLCGQATSGLGKTVGQAASGARTPSVSRGRSAGQVKSAEPGENTAQ